MGRGQADVEWLGWRGMVISSSMSLAVGFGDDGLFRDEDTLRALRTECAPLE